MSGRNLPQISRWSFHSKASNPFTSCGTCHQVHDPTNIVENLFHDFKANNSAGEKKKTTLNELKNQIKELKQETFHYTAWSIGILITTPLNWVRFHPLQTPNNQGPFFSWLDSEVANLEKTHDHPEMFPRS